MVLADGWIEYVAPEVEYVERQPSRFELIQELVVKQFNERTDVENNEALKMAILVYNWSEYLNKSLKAGQIVSYEDKLYRVIQDVNVVLNDQYPSINTASIYEVIDKEHDGTINDPIPYATPMEIFEGKIYSQFDVLYKCIRNSGTPLNHNLSDLLNIYVEVIYN